jgi:hypothetical protein
MKHTDSRRWWEDLPEAMGAYGTVCATGWKGIVGIDIPHLYDRMNPTGLFLTYYALLAAIEDYVSAPSFRCKYKESIDKLKGSKGGPQ